MKIDKSFKIQPLQRNPKDEAFDEAFNEVRKKLERMIISAFMIPIAKVKSRENHILPNKINKEEHG